MNTVLNCLTFWPHSHETVFPCLMSFPSECEIGTGEVFDGKPAKKNPSADPSESTSFYKRVSRLDEILVEILREFALQTGFQV